jgi:LPS export ABC transporter protein LptC
VLTIFNRKLFLAILVSIFFVKSTPIVYGQVSPSEGQQQMADFSLSGFGEKGKKSWDLTGKQADIAAEVIKLNNIESNFYGIQESTKLTALRGDFNRLKGSVHLEDDVVITTSSGVRLTTDSLDWDRQKQMVSTMDKVNIVKDDVTINGQGATAHTDLNKVSLQKDVKVQINNSALPGGQKKEKIEIVCEGPLEVDYQKNIAVFQNKVKVQTQDGLIESDTMDVHFTPNKGDKKEPKAAGEADDFNGSKIDKIIARGNVKITRGQNISYSEQAVYSALDRKVTLTGRPKVIIYSSEGLNASFGN